MDHEATVLIIAIVMFIGLSASPIYPKGMKFKE